MYDYFLVLSSKSFVIGIDYTRKDILFIKLDILVTQTVT